jgi:hypothetical protein
MQMENNYIVKTVDEMPSEELTRWLCLFEAVDLVTENANKKSIDLNKTNDWIKPLSFKSYIKETYFSMLDKVCYHRNEIPKFDKGAYEIIEVTEQEIVEAPEEDLDEMVI